MEETEGEAEAGGLPVVRVMGVVCRVRSSSGRRVWGRVIRLSGCERGGMAYGM